MKDVIDGDVWELFADGGERLVGEEGVCGEDDVGV